MRIRDRKTNDRPDGRHGPEDAAGSQEFDVILSYLIVCIAPGGQRPHQNMSLARLCEIVTDIIQRHMHRQAHKIANAERQSGRHCVTDTGHSSRLAIYRSSEVSGTLQPSPRLPETRTHSHNADRRHAAHTGTQTGTQGHDCCCCYCWCWCCWWWCYCCYCC